MLLTFSVVQGSYRLASNRFSSFFKSGHNVFILVAVGKTSGLCSRPKSPRSRTSIAFLEAGFINTFLPGSGSSLTPTAYN